MLRRVASSIKTGVGRTLIRRRITSSAPHSSPRLLLATAATATSGVLWYSSTGTVFNDANSRDREEHASLPVSTEHDAHSDRLFAVVWGSNKANIISPSSQQSAIFKVPSNAEWLQGAALRDFVAHEQHAACVDARGDVYQWGEGFFGGSDLGLRKPTLTLRDKDITHLQASASKLFALSASGRIYVLSAHSKEQERPTAKSPANTSPWWSTGWLWGEASDSDDVDYAEIAPNAPLSRGEKFVSIAAGNDHLLALTSKGRAFAHPITRKANAYGQLAMRKIDLPHPSSSGFLAKETRIEVDLIPKAVADPYWQSTPYARQSSTQAATSFAREPLSNVNDADVRFCDRLFEIPSLKGVSVAQVAAGARSSFARLESGRVLGWGANEYGQLGLGSQVRLNAITIPAEIVLGYGRTPCRQIYAGGDLTCFVVEQKKNDNSPTTVNLLFCGNGQWGGLGNNTFSNAQLDPIAVKSVSGLLEYNERSNSLEAIRPYSVSISPVGHVLLTQETLACSGPGGGGRDLVVWGSNYEYQLGLGKRGSLAAPRTLHRPDGSRFMLTRKKAEIVKDLRGRVWKKGVCVEQRAVALRGSTVVYCASA